MFNKDVKIPLQEAELVGTSSSNTLVAGTTQDPTDKRKQVFSECVHIAWDNLFSGDEVLCYLGEGVWKGTMTC